jgi:hypothetical protein
VHDDVDAAESCDGSRHHRIDRRRIGDVDLERERSGDDLEFGTDRGECRRVPVGQRDRRTALRKRARAREADPARRARDERGFPAEVDGDQ